MPNSLDLYGENVVYYYVILGMASFLVISLQYNIQNNIIKVKSFFIYFSGGRESMRVCNPRLCRYVIQ